MSQTRGPAIDHSTEQDTAEIGDGTLSAATIMVVEDHAIVRQGCRNLLTQAGFEVTWDGADSESAYRRWLADQPDVVVVDLSLNGVGGLEIIRRIACHETESQVVVFSMHDDPTLAVRALKAGAVGYVTKTSPPESLVEAVRCALQGKPYLSQEIAQTLALSELSFKDNPLTELSDRELEVFQLLIDGNNSAQIAEKLSLSPKSVSNHVGKIKQKLGAGSIADLVRISINSGFAKQNVVYPG